MRKYRNYRGNGAAQAAEMTEELENISLLSQYFVKFCLNL